MHLFKSIMNNKNADTNKKKFTVRKISVERIVFWIGSIAGIIISLFTIYDRLLEPKDAKLDINFFESASKDIYIISPAGNVMKYKDAFPMQLKLANIGGKIAKHVKLYISYSAIQLETKYGKEIKRTWKNPNDAMTQISLILDDLNPGESILIPIRVKLDFPTDNQRAIYEPNVNMLDTNSIHLQTFSLDCDISSETSISTNSELFITIGRLDKLQEKSSKIFWIGYGKKDTILLEANDDYLKHK